VEFVLEGNVATLDGSLDRPLVTWGEELIAQPTEPAGQVYALAEPEVLPAALYVGDELLRRGSLAAVERADGARLDFTLPGADDLLGDDEGRPGALALVGDAIRIEGPDFTLTGNEIIFATAPAFNTPIRLITADYEYLDEATGTVVLARPSASPPRAAIEVVALAEALVGVVDGENRKFTLQHSPLVESDPNRRL